MDFTNCSEYYFGGNQGDMESTRELILVMLEQLAISYDKLNRQDEVKPLLDRLMYIACKPPRAGKFPS